MRLSSSRITALTHRPQQDFPLWDKAGTRPSLDLQFADRKDLVDATTGSNLVDFTRASSGTYVGSDGLIKTATTDEARFDHDPTTGESLGLLVEESRTNLLLQSEDFSTTWTTRFSATLTSNQAIAPDGANTADLLQLSNSSRFSGLRQFITLSPSTSYSFSVYVRSVTGTAGFGLKIYDGVSDQFSLNLTATTSWQRFVFTITTAAGAGGGDLQIMNTSTPGSDSIYLWGAQLEAGSFPSSYIPTEGSTVTRAADVATDTSTGADIRTLYAQFRSPASGTRPIASLDDNSANERIELLTSGTDPKLLVTDGGSAVADLDAGAITANVTTKLAGRFATDNYAAAVNGGTPQTDTGGTLPTVDRLRIGSDQAGNYFSGTIARLTGWNTGLPDSTLETITQ